MASISVLLGRLAAGSLAGSCGAWFGVATCCGVSCTGSGGAAASLVGALRLVMLTPPPPAATCTWSSTASTPLPSAAKAVFSGSKFAPSRLANAGLDFSVLTTSVLASTTVLGWMPAIACAVFKPLRSPPGAISAATACVSEVTLAVCSRSAG